MSSEKNNEKCQLVGTRTLDVCVVMCVTCLCTRVAIVEGVAAYGHYKPYRYMSHLEYCRAHLVNSLGPKLFFIARAGARCVESND